MTRRLCSTFYCSRRKGYYCCADCGFASKNCKGACLNHPSRCNLVAGSYFDPPKGKRKEETQ